MLNSQKIQIQHMNICLIKREDQEQILKDQLPIIGELILMVVIKDYLIQSLASSSLIVYKIQFESINYLHLIITCS